jgi:hypothetical protein
MTMILNMMIFQRLGTWGLGTWGLGTCQKRGGKKLASFVAAALWISPLLAADVRFDAEPLVTCLDVTTEEFRAIHPDERLMEARVRLSTLVKFGLNENDLRLFVAIHTGTTAAKIHDFRPQTTTHSSYAGNLNVESTDEKLRSLGLAATGAVEPVKLTGNANLSSKNGEKVRYELLPPLETLTASGTLERGTGVYFKMKSSPQHTLEGSRDFVAVLRVDEKWRGGLVAVQAQAFRKSGKLAGDAHFLLALHLANDPNAKDAAERLLVAEALLRKLAKHLAKDIKNNSLPTVAHRLGHSLSVVDAKIDKDWLDQVVFSADSTEVRGYARLPRRVREATQAFARARRELLSL